MKLPNGDRAVVEQAKALDYLLALEHPIGGAKAAFFIKFGFTPDDWDTFARALLDQAATTPLPQFFKPNLGQNI